MNRTFFSNFSEAFENLAIVSKATIRVVTLTTILLFSVWIGNSPATQETHEVLLWVEYIAF